MMGIASTGVSHWENSPSLRTRAAYSVAETAELLGLCEASIYRALKRGDLTSVLIGGRRLIPALSINKLLNDETTTNEAA
jgi:excisionase family DNA binding protein